MHARRWLLLWLLAGVARGEVLVSTESSTVETNYDRRVSATDLINTGQPSYVSMSNTVGPESPFGMAGTHDGLAYSYYPANGGTPALSQAHDAWYLNSAAQTTLTYVLNTNAATGGSAAGYNITNVTVYAGWATPAACFAGQKWTLRVATVGNSVFQDVRSIHYAPFASASGDGSTKVTVSDAAGPLASGVRAVQFFVERPGGIYNGTVYREIDVMGTPSETPTNPPAPPTGLTATGLGTRISLSWTGSPGAAGYNVKRSLTRGGPYTVIVSGVAGTAYPDTGLAARTTYYYVVSARNAAGESADSNEASATTTEQPLRIQCVGDSITAGYTDNPTWNVPFEFGYRSALYTRLTQAGYAFQFVGASAEPWNGAFGLPRNTPSPDLRAVDQDHHRGYGGWGTGAVLANIAAWVGADDPDVVLLMIGINDGGSVAARNNLNAIVQAIVTAKPAADVIVAQITPTAGYQQSIVDYNTYIRDTLVPAFRGQGKRVSTVNQYTNLLTNGAIDPALFSNGINHPDAVAYDRMAETWFRGILAVRPRAPRLSGLNLQGSAGGASLGFAGDQGVRYRLMFKSNLVAAAWTATGDGWTNGPGGFLAITNPLAPAITQRYYRLQAISAVNP